MINEQPSLSSIARERQILSLWNFLKLQDQLFTTRLAGLKNFKVSKIVLEVEDHDLFGRQRWLMLSEPESDAIPKDPRGQCPMTWMSVWRRSETLLKPIWRCRLSKCKLVSTLQTSEKKKRLARAKIFPNKLKAGTDTSEIIFSDEKLLTR